MAVKCCDKRNKSQRRRANATTDLRESVGRQRRLGQMPLAPIVQLATLLFRDRSQTNQWLNDPQRGP